jgi:hypothetical protein
MHPLNPLSGNAPYFSILLCLTPDNFTHQVESAATQWDNQVICSIISSQPIKLHCTLMHQNFIIFIIFTVSIMPDDFTCQWKRC